ncbi:MAG: efflux RND transporter periplasmic adaptor subunit [Sphingomonadales bacterium]
MKQAGSRVVLLGLLCAATLAACGKDGQQAPPAPEVKIYTVQPVQVPRVVELPGRVQAVRTAEVRARVDGIVERRLYQEGTDVKEGAPLFRIDPREMQAAYDQASGALSRAQATARNAAQVVDRYQPLVDKQAISRQEYDAAVAAAAQAEADVVSAQAAIERANLNLDYTTVTAPLSGRAGRAQVTEGALVKASEATLLTTIEQLDPIYVNFTQSSTELLKLRRDIQQGKVQGVPLDRVRVILTLEDGSLYDQEGHLNFLDMSVDASTGSVSVRAEFQNEQRLLLPGQFVRARIEGAAIEMGIVVPQRAVQVKPEGASVLVVGKDNVLEARAVRLGTLHGTLWVIESGLKAGDKVVTDGIQHARVGAPVRIEGEAGIPPVPAAKKPK